MNLQTTKTIDVPDISSGIHLRGLNIAAVIIALGHFPQVTNQTTSQLQRLTKAFYASYVGNQKETHADLRLEESK